MQALAYTYEADVHCPACTIARFGRDKSGRAWPPEDARDREGNPLGAIFPWDDTCLGGEDADRTWIADPETGRETAHCTLACGTCGRTIDDHLHTREA